MKPIANLLECIGLAIIILSFFSKEFPVSLVTLPALACFITAYGFKEIGKRLDRIENSKENEQPSPGK